jgi:hypothetical protein
MKGSEKLFGGLDDSDLLTLTVGRLRDLVRYHTSDPPEFLSTVQASQIIGWSRQYWAQRAAAGVIDGAFADEGDRWHLPLGACRAHVGRLEAEHRKGRLRGRCGPRGPRRKA